MENPEQIIALIQTYLAEYGLKVVAAILIFIVGRIVAGWLRRFAEKVMNRRQVDPTLVGFVSSLAYIGMMAFVILAALGQLGIETTSFIAVLGAAGLAIGLALQGSLANFAAGFLLIMFRPFKAGDFIEGGGVSGVVEKIEMFTTTLKTGDNKTIIVPNGKLANDNIVNYSAKETRRVDLTVGASYDADIKHVKQVLEEIVKADERVLADPAPMVAVGELADSSVNFVVRAWVKSGDYWGVFFDTTEAVKLRFDQEGIELPYPQRDVHLYEEKKAS
ncbi:MAG: mechanosensitive ion channel family protein [Gammaproteobacteria bacterium]|nr:MAG: mechanosensitive ion channel family protein [Gammaproteobacteria bacterium]